MTVLLKEQTRRKIENCGEKGRGVLKVRRHTRMVKKSLVFNFKSDDLGQRTLTRLVPVNGLDAGEDGGADEGEFWEAIQ